LEKVWKKFGKSLEKVRKSSETGFSEHSEFSEIVLFQTFQKLRKNDLELELQKLQKKLAPTRKLTQGLRIYFVNKKVLKIEV